MKQALWRLAEHADWHDWRPFWFWNWALRSLDRAQGYHNFDYGDD